MEQAFRIERSGRRIEEEYDGPDGNDRPEESNILERFSHRQQTHT
jgi:hypothetical protein